ncbi:MAG: ABC transporter ATP-binding protein [Candidatus Marinimicrobia bacterium]|nr:ABC transporter ATP-binding protein [Candidatus Neomarinimicrobiota bacterium]
MIQLIDIEKYYQTGAGKTFVLRNINLEIDQGEFVSIMGPSGAGKSTLLHILGVLDDPSGGSYLLDGHEVSSLSDKHRGELRREMIGFIFQAYHLIDELTVYENIETPLLYRKVKSAERRGMVSDILDRFQIVGKKDLFPAQLSGGQQQVVGVARALISSPRLLLADEPTGNLSSKEGETIMGLFKELHEAGTTIVQATHSEANAAWADRVINLQDGWIT